MKTALLLISFITLASCSNYERTHYTQSGGLSEQNDLLPSSELGFIQIRKQVLETKCLDCHSGRSKPDLQTYTDVFQARNEIYRAVFVTQKMPKGGFKLADNDKANLKSWLDAGAPEFGSSLDEPLPVAANPALPSSGTFQMARPVLWAQVKEKVFARRCVACHYEGNDLGVSNYQDYLVTKNTAGTIYALTAINPVMPPPNQELNEGEVNPNQLSREEKDIIAAWINDGMLEINTAKKD